jgi:hypothetical protein
MVKTSNLVFNLDNEEQLRQLAEVGTVKATDRVRTMPNGEWVAAGTHPELSAFWAPEEGSKVMKKSGKKNKSALALTEPDEEQLEPIDKKVGEQAKSPIDKKVGEQAKSPIDKKVGEQAKSPIDKKSAKPPSLHTVMGPPPEMPDEEASSAAEETGEIVELLESEIAEEPEFLLSDEFPEQLRTPLAGLLANQAPPPPPASPPSGSDELGFDELGLSQLDSPSKRGTTKSDASLSTRLNEGVKRPSQTPLAVLDSGPAVTRTSSRFRSVIDEDELALLGLDGSPADPLSAFSASAEPPEAARVDEASRSKTSGGEASKDDALRISEAPPTQEPASESTEAQTTERRKKKKKKGKKSKGDEPKAETIREAKAEPQDDEPLDDVPSTATPRSLDETELQGQLSEGHSSLSTPRASMVPEKHLSVLDDAERTREAMAQAPKESRPQLELRPSRAGRPAVDKWGEQTKSPIDKKVGEQTKSPIDKKVGEQAKSPIDKKSDKKNAPPSPPHAPPPPPTLDDSLRALSSTADRLLLPEEEEILRWNEVTLTNFRVWAKSPSGVFSFFLSRVQWVAVTYRSHAVLLWLASFLALSGIASALLISHKLPAMLGLVFGALLCAGYLVTMRTEVVIGAGSQSIRIMVRGGREATSRAFAFVELVDRQIHVNDQHRLEQGPPVEL